MKLKDQWKMYFQKIVSFSEIIFFFYKDSKVKEHQWNCKCCFIPPSFLLLHNHWKISKAIPAKVYWFKVINKNNRKKCEISSKLKIKTPKWRYWRCSGVCIVIFRHISYRFFGGSIVDFDHLSVCCDYCKEFNSTPSFVIGTKYPRFSNRVP